MAKKATTKATTRKKTARKPRTTKTDSTPTNEVLAVSEARIRERAYEISRTRSGPADPVADWFQAEQELKTRARA